MILSIPLLATSLDPKLHRRFSVVSPSTPNRKKKLLCAAISYGTWQLHYHHQCSQDKTTSSFHPYFRLLSYSELIQLYQNLLTRTVCSFPLPLGEHTVKDYGDTEKKSMSEIQVKAVLFCLSVLFLVLYYSTVDRALTDGSNYVYESFNRVVCVPNVFAS